MNKIKTALEVLNQVEPNGELLDTETAIRAMEEYAQQFSNLVEAPVSPMLAGEWQKEKPSKPCLMVVKKCGLDNLEYQLFELQYYQGYLAVICDDGEEWGDYDSLQALEYFVIEYYDSKHSD